MNKDQTLAAHRIKTTIAQCTKNEANANRKARIAEAKTKKVTEAFDAAKKVVDQHKTTLELAKQQILENRALIERYEALLNIKFRQVETLKKTNASLVAENKKLAKAKECGVPAVQAKVVPEDEQAVKASNAAKAKVEAKAQAQAKIVSIYETKYSIPASVSNRLLTKHGLNEGVNRIQKLIEQQKKVETSTVRKTRPVKTTEASQSKKSVNVDEAKAKQIAAIYSKKYKMPENASMNILRRYGLFEGAQKLQEVANTVAKYAPKDSTVKTNESKSTVKTDDSSTMSLYSLFI